MGTTPERPAFFSRRRVRIFLGVSIAMLLLAGGGASYLLGGGSHPLTVANALMLALMESETQARRVGSLRRRAWRVVSRTPCHRHGWLPSDAAARRVLAAAWLERGEQSNPRQDCPPRHPQWLAPGGGALLA